MAVTVTIEPDGRLPRRDREQLAEIVDLFARLAGRLGRGERRAIHGELARAGALDDPGERRGEPHPAIGGTVAAPEEQALVGLRSLLQFFEARRAALEDGTATAPQVAEILGVSRQTPLNRVREKTLLGVLDRGAWRFPLWQLDPAGPDGVVAGLPETLRALEPQPAFAKLVWLRRPNPALGGREPVEALRGGEVQPVVEAARAASELP